MKKGDFNKIIELVKDKTVSLVSHWDCDGVTSGALIYHAIKNEPKKIYAKTKGEVFSVMPQDVEEDSEIVICIDIAPSLELLEQKKVILIDHHPFEYLDKTAYHVYDKEKQSCSLLIYEEILEDKQKVDKLNVFLTLLGFFGDGGSNKEIPLELQIIANELLDDVMKKNKSYYNNDYYLDIEKFVSLMNIGKRIDWSGDRPLKLLMQINDYHELTNYSNPIAIDLLQDKSELTRLYNRRVNIQDLGHIHMIEIECDKNIQGVICARNMQNKPIIVINKNNRGIMASMRVPDSLDFNAGEFLNSINVQGVIAGGHEKAGGASIEKEKYYEFKEALIENRI
ncbi:DHH family phosphoesterase [Candidatus Woesearchaeota archaeon]|nr:DHH family phosphoesterase [Candidatus Woesearchaeota archaeon]